MLQNTFVHVPGVGLKTEERLWREGMLHWSDLCKSGCHLNSRRMSVIRDHIVKSGIALERRDAQFFKRLSLIGEAWRTFPDFADNCVYLDIETTGLSPRFDDITVAGLYADNEFRHFVAGRDLHRLPQELRKYSVIVTFNGSGFDLPFINAVWPKCVLPPIHIDLRWATYKLGMRGGLKEIELEFGIHRPKALAEMDGFEAVHLWQEYKAGSKKALTRLIEYNCEDVCNLLPMMKSTFVQLKRLRAPFLTRARAAHA